MCVCVCVCVCARARACACVCVWPAACPAMKQVRSALMCCIDHVLPLLLMLVLWEGVLLALSDPGWSGEGGGLFLLSSRTVR